MKTNASQMSAAVPGRFPPDCAFTLTELVVVMGTLAVLGLVVLPALARSGDDSARTVCANNLRQLGTALNMYAGENQDYMPWPNWGDGGGAAPVNGWLYGNHGCNYPTNLNTGNAATSAQNWVAGRAADLQTGVYWQYVPNADAFYCPVDRLSVGSTVWNTRSQKLSSYVMNGAACFYPPLGNIATYGYKTCKLSQVWSPQCYIQWEPNPANGFTYNDGASYPNLSEGLGNLHIVGGNALAINGSVTLLTPADFSRLEMPVNRLNGPRTLFHWNPLTTAGTGLGESIP
jgi:type II secretory pathway pseudopilin PulG